MQHLALPMYAQNGLEKSPKPGVAQRPIDQRGTGAVHFPQKIGLGQQPVSPSRSPLSRQSLFPHRHQQRKIDSILMGRRVGAMVEAEFAVVTFIDHAVVVCCRKFRDIAVVLINPIEQRIEGGTEIEATAAPVAHIINTQRFLFEGGRIDRLQET